MSSAWAVQPEQSASVTDSGLRNGFADENTERFKIGIMGDLHLEPDSQFMEIFETARHQLRDYLGVTGEGPPPKGARIIQLGDVGGYKARPGSRQSLEFGRKFLDGFGVEAATVVGNHDLEGEDFDTDEANLEAWRQIMGQRHHWAAKLGPLLCIGLSTVKFRSNPFSVHEVHVDPEQLEWLEGILSASGDSTPVALFTHAPPMGSGLQVVQEVHVKNRCAWLNHSSDPAAFIRLTRRYPNIRLWFSGHFHLSHNYPDSISVVGNCAFVQTGVIGECNRDGHRQSRLLRGDATHFEVATLDHETGETRVDLSHRWDDPEKLQPRLHEDALICDPDSGGWLCSQLWCDEDLGDNPMTPQRNAATWFAVGATSSVALQGFSLVEYDNEYRAPIGLVCLDVDPVEERVVLLDDGGAPLSADGSDSAGGESVAAMALLHTNGTSRVFRRDPLSRLWFVVYQYNKWQKKLQQRAAALHTSSESQPV